MLVIILRTQICIGPIKYEKSNNFISPTLHKKLWYLKQNFDFTWPKSKTLSLSGVLCAI